MIQLVNVSKSYNGKDFAVDNLDLIIPAGKITGFIGPNGAGKTTTLKMITGIIKQSSGKILINNIDISKDSIKAKKIIGYAPDSPDMFLKLRGIEYLDFIADIYEIGSKSRESIINKYADLFEISDALNDKLQSYSHGMRQKIIILSMLIHNPDIYVLDEPLTGLDPKSSFTLKEILKEKALEGKTIFFSTHILEVAEKLCDNIAIINKGKLLFTGTIDEMKNNIASNSSLEQMFLELTEK